MLYCPIYLYRADSLFGQFSSRFTSRGKRDRAFARFYRKVGHKLNSARELREISSRIRAQVLKEHIRLYRVSNVSTFEVTERKVTASLFVINKNL